MIVDSNIPMYLIGAAHPHKIQARPFDLQRARDILMGTKGLSARDSPHAAVIERHGVQQIMSFDGGYDQIAGLARLYK